MKKHWLPPLLALAGGGVGFGLRRWQLATGFEPDTGLALPGAAAALALIGWSALMAGVLVLLCRVPRRAETAREAFPAQGNVVFLTACVLGAFLLLISAGVDMSTLPLSGKALLGGSNGQTKGLLSTLRVALGGLAPILLPALRVVLSALGFPCVLWWAAGLYRDPDKTTQSVTILEPCLLFCTWLISAYQARAGDPVIMDYIYEVLAIVCGLLGLYHIAGWAFQNGKPRRTACLCLLGAYFALVTLADRHTLTDLLRYGFAILFLTAHAVLLLDPAPPVTQGPETEENTDE